MMRLLPIVLAAGAGLVFHASPAHACDCIVHFAQSWPGDDARDFPTNGVLLYLGTDVELELLGPGGETVATRVTRLAGTFGDLQVFAPEAELQPNTSYGATFLSAGEVIEAWQLDTGERAAQLTDEPPSVELGEAWSTQAVPPMSLCGTPTHGVELIATLPEGSVAGVIQLEDDATPTTLPTGDLAVALHFEPREGGSPTRVALGNGGCSSGWPEATGGAQASPRVGAIDAAGRLSWSTPAEVELPMTAIVPGCTQAAPSSLGGLLALMGAVACGRARRRSRSTATLKACCPSTTLSNSRGG